MTTLGKRERQRDDGSVQRRPLVFVHIPKTAGSSLSSALMLNYRKRDTYLVDRNDKESIDRFKNLPYERRSSIKLLKGHMPFGLHAWLPGEPVHVTMLRNPVDRIVSHYYYVLRRPEHYLYERVTGDNMSLEDYVASGMSIEMDNGQTRILAGIGANVAFGMCTTDHLAEAVENLRSNFSVVGISDRFDESLLIMESVLGWNAPPLYVRRNVSKRRPARHELPTSTVRLIERHNALDCELYEVASRRFTEQATEYVSASRLRRFRTLNRAYQWCASPVAGGYSLLRRIARESSLRIGS